jgi:hypothetical protein
MISDRLMFPNSVDFAYQFGKKHLTDRPLKLLSKCRFSVPCEHGLPFQPTDKKCLKPT